MRANNILHTTLYFKVRLVCYFAVCTKIYTSTQSTQRPSRSQFAVGSQSVLLGFEDPSTKGLILDYVPSLQRTQSVPIMKIRRLKLFRKTIVLYSKNYTKHAGTLCGQSTHLVSFTAGGTEAWGYQTKECVLKKT
jgi:hypothetical protein